MSRTNVNLDEPPVNYSQEVMRKAGSNYWYEEAVIPIAFFNSNNGSNSIIADCFFVKRGREVTLTIPIVGFNFTIQGAITTGNNVIPQRFRPVQDAGGFAESPFGLTQIILTKDQGGVNTLGTMFIKGTGEIEIRSNFDGEFPPQSHIVYATSHSYVAQSSFNVPYV